MKNKQLNHISFYTDKIKNYNDNLANIEYRNNYVKQQYKQNAERLPKDIIDSKFDLPGKNIYQSPGFVRHAGPRQTRASITNYMKNQEKLLKIFKSG